METVYTFAMALATPTSTLDATSEAAIATATSTSVSPSMATLLASNPYLSRISQYGPYGYTPNLWLPILFSSLFALSALLHAGQVAYTRHWWLSILVFGCIAEAAGNGIRIYGHFEGRTIDPYIAQQVILVVTPVFFAAVHFATLGRIIELFGRDYTPMKYLSPAAITPCFVLLDLASLAVQGTGSGLAATAEVNGHDTTWGGRIVVIGLCVQLVGYTLFNWLLLTFFWRAVVTHRHTVSSNPYWTGKFKFFLVGFFLSSLLVLGRSTFRTLEMIKGWVGPISTVEWYFYAFDAAPVCAASLVLNLWYPGWVLPAKHRQAVEDLAAARAKARQSHASFGGGIGGGGLMPHDGGRDGGTGHGKADSIDDRFSIYTSSVKFDHADHESVPHQRTNSLGVPLHRLQPAASSSSTLHLAPVPPSKSPSYYGDADDGASDYYAAPLPPSASRTLLSSSHSHNAMEGSEVMSQWSMPSPSPSAGTFGWSHPRAPSSHAVQQQQEQQQQQHDDAYRNSNRFSSGAFAM